MYQPAHFREDRLDVLHGLITAHPLGLLVTAGPGGLMANPVPFLLEAGTSEFGSLRAHVARANDHWRELTAVDECLIVFQGPQHYISPGWYATKRETGKVVPTWNYTIVEAWGRPRVMDNGTWLHRQLNDLTDSHEQSRPAPWKVADAPESFIAAQMNGIIGIEIGISRIIGKWKVSQNRPAEDRAGVHAGLAEGDAAAQDMARLVAERGGL